MTEGRSVVDNPPRRRFELREGERVLGWVDYLPAGASVIFAHTEIGEEHEGQGLGSVVVREALDQARASGRTVIPNCPFTAAFIQPIRSTSTWWTRACAAASAEPRRDL